MKYYLVAVDTLGYLRHLEEHHSFFYALSRWRRLRHQWKLRSASLRLYAVQEER